MDIPTAYKILNRSITVAARCALADGLKPDEVAAELYALADAIENPETVSEDMSAIDVPLE